MKTTLQPVRWLACAFAGLLSTSQVSAQSNNDIFYQRTLNAQGYYADSWHKVLKTDVNGDGITDLVVTGRGALDLYLFKASGEFRKKEIDQYPHMVGDYGAAVAADLNGDGKLDFAWYDPNYIDVVVSYYNSTNTAGDPEYSTPATLGLTGLENVNGGYYYGPQDLNAADIDNDGDTDLLAFGSIGSQKPGMIINNGDGTFTRYDLQNTPIQQCFSRIADMNGDGRPDLIVGGKGSIDLYTNTGNAGNPSLPVFTRAALLSTSEIPGFDASSGWFDLADFDQDGKTDILVSYPVYRELDGYFYGVTTLFVNRTNSAPAYNFIASHLLDVVQDNTNERLGGYGAGYADVDNNGTLDIIGNRGGHYGNQVDKVTVMRLTIDAAGHATGSESTVLDYNALDGYNFQGMNLRFDDIDGDNKTDYIFATTNSGVISRQTVFPVRKSPDVTVELSGTLFIGGDRNDDVELTISSSDPNSTLYFYNYSQATIDGLGTPTIVITGKVGDVNMNMGFGNVTFPDMGNYTLTYSVKNLTTLVTSTRSQQIILAPPTFYPKPGMEASVHNPQSWSDAPDGSGQSPIGFNPGFQFIFSNSAGATEFSGDDFYWVESNLSLPKGAVLTLNGMLIVMGRLDMKGKIEGQGRLSIQTQKPVNLHGNVKVQQLEVYTSDVISIKGRLEVLGYTDLYYGVLKIDSGSIYIKGPLYNNGGQIDATTGEVRLQGNGQFVNYSWFRGNVQKLTVDGDDISYISDNLIVDTLNFEKGLLLLSNSQVSANVIIGGSSSSYAIAEFGALKMRLEDGQTGKFPVGSNHYNPVTITNHSGAADVFAVLSLNEGWNYEVYQKLNPESRVYHVWEIEKANPNGGNGVDITLGWDVAQEEQMGLAGLYHFENIDWVEVSDGTITRAPQQLTFKGYKGTFSPFAVMSSFITLPVTYERLEAKAVKATTVITWKTSNESNSSDFQIQRSVDGISWTTIGTVTAKNIATGSSYQFVDHQPVTGTNLYRLNQRDKDGKSNLSKIMPVTFAATPEGFKAYPNPVKDGVLSLQVKQPGMLTVYSAAGVQLVQKTLSAGTHQLNTGSWAKGVYTLMFNDEAKRVVIQ